MEKIKKILLVDDDEDFIFYLKRCLKKSINKLDVDYALDGADAIEKLNTEHYNCSIIDYNLPDYTGVTFIQACNQKNPTLTQKTAFIMATGLGNETIAVEAIQEGYTDYVPKDKINENNLLRIINNSIEKVEMKLLLQNKHKELLESNKQMQQFVGIVSHDLRNPLGLIRSSCDLYEDVSDKDKSEIINIIKKSCDTSLELVTELLDLTALQTGKLNISKSNFQLLPLFIESIDSNQHLIDKKEIQISLNIEKSHQVYADRNRILQVINNLITNAVKFTSHGKLIQCSSEKLDSNIKIMVQDQGTGIEDKIINHLFDKHINTSNIGTNGEKGTGFGLPLSQEIIIAHDSEIQVKSKLKVGSTFSFELPSTRND